MPEHAVHGHQVIGFFRRTNIADAGPFGVPSVCSIVAMTCFWQPVKTPFALVAHSYQNGFMVPAVDPDWIRFRMLIAINSTRTGHLSKLVSSDNFPILPIPFGQYSRLDIKFFQGFGRGLTIVAVNCHALTGVESLAMCTGKESPLEIPFRVVRFFLDHIDIFIQDSWFKCFYIYFIKTLLHGSKVNFIGRICEVPGIAGMTSRHFLVRDNTYISVGINRVGSDEKLITLLMDHPVCRSSSYTFGPDSFLEIRSYLVEFIG